MNRRDFLGCSAVGFALLPFGFGRQDFDRDQPLSEESVAALARRRLPPENACRQGETFFGPAFSEDFGRFARDRPDFVGTVGELDDIVTRHLPDALAKDRCEATRALLKGEDDLWTPRHERGVYYYHVGLLRLCCDLERARLGREPEMVRR